MNINYDEIITKANARKDALKEFEVAMAHLSDVLDDEAIIYRQALQRYKKACEGLDAEAHAMLPSNLAHVLNGWASNMLGYQTHFLIASQGCVTPQKALAGLLES